MSFDNQVGALRHDGAGRLQLPPRGAAMNHLPRTHPHVARFPLNTNCLLCYIIIAAADCLHKALNTLTVILCGFRQCLCLPSLLTVPEGTPATAQY